MEPTKKDVESNAAPAPKAKADLIGFFILGMTVLNIVAMGGMGFYIKKMWMHLEDVQAQVTASAEKREKETRTVSSVGKEMEHKTLGTLFPIDSFLVNVLSDQGPKFLQAQMEIELADPAVEEEVARKKAAIRDAIIVLMSSRSYKQLREPVGMKKLRQDILGSVNNLLTTGKVKEIYFTQFHFN